MSHEGRGLKNLRPSIFVHFAQWEFSFQPTVFVVSLQDGTRALEAVDNVTVAFQWRP